MQQISLENLKILKGVFKHKFECTHADLPDKLSKMFDTLLKKIIENAFFVMRLIIIGDIYNCKIIKSVLTKKIRLN